MNFSFKEKVFKEGNRYFIRIPFNLWVETGKKGLIPIKATIMEASFQCKLISKGGGLYYIPVPKKLAVTLDPSLISYS